MSDRHYLEPGESFSGELIDVADEVHREYGSYQVLRMRGLDGHVRNIVVTTLLTELCSAIEHVRARPVVVRREPCAFCKCTAFDNDRCRNCGALSNALSLDLTPRRILVSLFCVRMDQTKKGWKVRVIDWAVGTDRDDAWIWKINPPRTAQ